MSFVWTSIVFRYYGPITTVFLRLVLSTIILFAGIRVFGKLEKIRKEDYKLFILSALFNPFLYFIGESYGLKLTSSTVSAVIITTIPLFTPIVAFYTLGERLTKLNIAGIIVSFLGIIIMLFYKNFSLNTSPLGLLLLLFAVASAIIYVVFLKKLSEKYSAFFIIAVQNLIGAVFFLPLFLIIEFDQFITVKPDFLLISSLLSLAVFCSSLAYVFYTISTKEIGISRTNIFTNLIPVFTAIFSYFILSEYFNFQKILGILIVIIGLFLSQIKKSKSLFKL
ncbi:MAG: DMT family transporter [Bacteroidales bacterium]|nr:DMT family transporter [Bacteroidales bacterium]